MNRTTDERVVALVAGQFEVCQVRRSVACNPIVIAEAGEKSIGPRPASVTPLIGMDKIVVELSDVPIDCRGAAGGVVVVAHRDDKLRVPSFDVIGHGSSSG